MANGTIPKQKWTIRDVVYIITLLVGIGSAWVTFSVRFALVEADIEDIKTEHRLYPSGILSNDVQNIKDDVAEIKKLVQAL